MDDRPGTSGRFDDHEIVLTEKQLRAIVSEGVYDALTRLGIETSSPVEMQKDFQHLREWRLATGEVRRKGLLTLVAILVSGFAAAVWIGFKGMMPGG